VPKVILYIASSLDGYIAQPDGDISWLDDFQLADEDYGYGGLLTRTGALVMGANTYRQVLGFGKWPYAGTTVYVMTHRGITAPADAQIETYAGEPKGLLEQIKARTDKDVWLVGGAQVNRAFLAAHLIDEYIISIMPVMLGDGIALFPGVTIEPQNVNLIEVKSYPNGVVQLHYEHRRGSRRRNHRSLAAAGSGGLGPV